jgi:8-oxo-dGTP pyrophosphatase MutT (NUDIX family)
VSHLIELRKLVGTRPLFSVGSAVIALDEFNRVLMQLRSDTKSWCFPGGLSELGETFLETAQRELLEETGLTASSWTFVTVLSGTEFFFTYPNGDQIYNVSAVYVAREISGEMRTDHESLELRWCNPNELPHVLAGPITRWIAASLKQTLNM